MHDILLSGNRREFPLCQDCGFQIPYEEIYPVRCRRDKDIFRSLQGGMYQTEIKGQETFPPARIIQYVLPFHPAFRGGAAVKRSESGMRTVPAGREDDLSVMMNRVYIVVLVLPLLAMCGQPEEDDDNYIVTTDEFSPEKKQRILLMAAVLLLTDGL